MAAKFYLCLLLIILGTLAVQGARLENKLENPLDVGAKRSRECSFALMTTALIVCVLINCVLAL